MSVVAGLSIKTIVMFVLIIGAQVVGGALLPKTDGFRNLAWTLACLGVYGVSFWAMATMIREGTALSLLIPMMTATIPIILVGVGYALYGEVASFSKVALLSACCIGVAYAGTLR